MSSPSLHSQFALWRYDSVWLADTNGESTKWTQAHDHQKHQRLHRLRGMREVLPLRRDPHGSDSGKAVITYPADCQICHLCRMYCPVDAIEMSPEKSIPVVVPWG